VRCIGSAQKTRFVANQSSWEKNGVIMQHVTFLAFNRSAKTGQIVFSLTQHPSAKTKKREKLMRDFKHLLLCIIVWIARGGKHIPAFGYVH
jgi:hypothetical protein